MTTALHIEYNDYSGKRHELTVQSHDKDDIVIGRRDSGFQPDINLSWDHDISRRHARIYYDYSTWYIEHIAGGNQTRVNNVLLTSDVPVELPPKATIALGKDGKSILQVTYTDGESLPEGLTKSSSAQVMREASENVSETRRIELIAQIAKILEQHDYTLLDRLVEQIRRYFPTLESGGIALYKDKEIYVPAFHPRGMAKISFTLARRAIKSQQFVQWDRQTASAESQYSSLKGTIQALYAPILRGAEKLGVIYLHTSAMFSNDDKSLLAAISEIIGANSKFQPESAHSRLPSVFVSYSHKDSDFMRRLAADLRRQRVGVWFDERLRAGKDWEMQLGAAIQQSDVFVLVMTPTSLASQYVQWEIEQAKKAGKRIMPLWYEECPNVPEDLNRIQRIDIRDDYVSGVLELVETLYEHVDSKSVPPPPPAPIAPVQRTVAPPPKEKIRILFLTANPRDTDQLRLGEEIRTIEERLRSTENRDQFERIIQAWAVRPSDLQGHILHHKPHILHFSGHGSSVGEIILEDRVGNSSPVDPKALGELFDALKDDDPSDDIRCVVLNACFSAQQAQVIADQVGCVVGMGRSVSDTGAIEFAGAFYRALGYGKSVLKAFKLARAEMAFFNEQTTPQLLTNGLDANQLILF